MKLSEFQRAGHGARARYVARTTVGSVLPATGDQDLFLHFFTATGPVVSSSRGGGLSLDVAWFTVPLFPWVPVFEVRGFTAGVCSVFTAHGA